MQEQRASVRTALHAEISIVRHHAALEHFRACNLSVGGLFIELPAKVLSVGDRLCIQFNDIGTGDRDHKHAIVVHQNEKGAGLAWMNNDSRFWIVLMQLIGASLRRAGNDDLENSARTPGRAGRVTRSLS